ncbi:MAG: class II aldolase/adducin family protein [Bacteroidetes bacterium]|nr:class II aldolase/adducin family protein [Bacteroidota bacterium]
MDSEWEVKKNIIEIGRRIWTRGYVGANDGNITVVVNDKEVLTTPHGVSKGFMTNEMIIKIDRTGKVIAGNSKYHPSSEVKMHLEVYKERPDIKSVIHAHPTYATSFAVAGIPLDRCVLPEAVLVIGAVPLAKYGLPSTMELAESIREHVKTSDAILLENHGALTLGTDLFDAYYKMETLEHAATIVWKAIQLGNVNVLSEHERERLMGLREKFNLQGPVAACNVSPITIADRPTETSSPNVSGKSQISEQYIKEITEKVLARIRAN